MKIKDVLIGVAVGVIARELILQARIAKNLGKARPKPDMIAVDYRTGDDGIVTTTLKNIIRII